MTCMDPPGSKCDGPNMADVCLYACMYALIDWFQTTQTQCLFEQKVAVPLFLPFNSPSIFPVPSLQLWFAFFNENIHPSSTVHDLRDSRLPSCFSKLMAAGVKPWRDFPSHGLYKPVTKSRRISKVPAILGAKHVIEYEMPQFLLENSGRPGLLGNTNHSASLRHAPGGWHAHASALNLSIQIQDVT